MGFASGTQTILIVGGLVALGGYLGLILAPAVVAYGRGWERLAAGLLSLLMLATLVAIGIALGLAFVWLTS